jgi:hypothetical protein
MVVFNLEKRLSQIKIKFINKQFSDKEKFKKCY